MMSNDLETREMKRTEDLEAAGSKTLRRDPPSFQKWIVLLVVIVICAGGLLLISNLLSKKPQKDKHGGRQGSDRPIPVTVATALTGSVPIEIHSIGNVLASATVNVIPQVSGQLSRVCFTQGQYVKKGDLLFEIDPRPYQAALDQALGNCARDQAQIEQAQANKQKDMANIGQLQANKARDTELAKYAGVEVNRYSTLVQQGAVSHEQNDQMKTNLATAKATIDADQKAIENAQAVVAADVAAIETARGTLKADQAAAENARIQLGWTKIRSPIDGRTSSLNVDQGNIVTANGTQSLVSIAQVQPIEVNFTVPEQHLDVVRANLASGKVKVEAYIEGERADSVQGNVSFLESTVNTTTGTIVMRAAFPNQNLRLYPGQFVDVVLSMPAPKPTVVIPAAALQSTQQGTAVWIMKDNNTVRFSPVEVLRTRKDEAAVSSGVQDGDVVITDGQLQLIPGSKVKVVKSKLGSSAGN